MDVDAIRDYCASRTGASAGYPFGPGALVFKVMGKVFALLAKESPARLSLKCDPELADMLRQRYEAVGPGYHLNKRHWNTVTLDGRVPDGEITWMIDHSYDLVVAGLTRAERQQLSR